MIGRDVARTLAEKSLRENFSEITNRFDELEKEKVVPNSTINNEDYWGFWVVQQDEKLGNSHYVRSNLGLEPGKILTFTGQPPLILLFEIRINKSNEEVEFVNFNRQCKLWAVGAPFELS